MTVHRHILPTACILAAILAWLAFGGIRSQATSPSALPMILSDTIFGPEPLEAGQHRYLLPIEARQQWTQNNGYCGETSIQQSAMLFGNYISQFVCREIADPTQKHDVLIDQGAVRILDAVKLTSQLFDNSGPAPQYERYLVWVKRHLSQGHPVLLSVFSPHGSADDYDHIVLGVGLASSDPNRFLANDRFIYDDHFASEIRVARADLFHDTRAMNDSGSKSKYCVPDLLDYGCAITGVKDESGALCPVQVQLDRSDEPDVIGGDDPVQLQAKVLVSGLKPGRDYVLYRYDRPGDVPLKNYSNRPHSRSTPFRAIGTTQQFEDIFASNGFAAYRCEKVAGGK